MSNEGKPMTADSTPRTDAEAGYYDDSGCWKNRPTGECVRVDFARQLERELAQREGLRVSLPKITREMAEQFCGMTCLMVPNRELESGYDWTQTAVDFACLIAGAAEARCQAAERDARRYRWLREHWGSFYSLYCIDGVEAIELSDTDLNGEMVQKSIDAAIDAALAAHE